MRRTVLKKKGFWKILLVLFCLIGTMMLGRTISADDGYDYSAYNATHQYEDFSSAFYVKRIDGTEPDEMVFCFNIDLKGPRDIGKEDGNTYRKVDGTLETFKQYAKNPYQFKLFAKGDLRDYILGIIYEAYYNPSPIINKASISDGSLRRVVQLAIWYYTDSYQLSDARNMLNSKTLSEAEKAVYNKLINTNSHPDNFGLDLYLSANPKSQHLLGTRITNRDKTIQLRKVDAADNSKLLDGAIFKFIPGDGFTDPGEFERTSSATNSDITVPAGMYRIVETKAPTNYDISPTWASGSGVVIKIDDAGTLYRREIDSSTYQSNWIPVADNALVVENTKRKDIKHSLTISKKVTGIAGDKSKVFHFSIMLKDGKGVPLAGPIQTGKEAIQLVDGVGSFNLTDGQTLTVNDLPDGYSYEITETNAEGYTVMINGQSVVEAKTSADGVDKEVTVAFENRKDEVVPTGLRTTTWTYLSLLLVVVSGLGAWSYLFRKKV